jgi:hypothetical protein
MLALGIATATEITLIVNGGSVPDVMETLSPMFESATGNKVKISLKAGPAILDWAEGFFAAMQPFNAGEVYVNSLDQGGGHRVREAYGINYDRLVALKAKFDPTNFFRSNQNIPPRYRPGTAVDRKGGAWCKASTTSASARRI